MNKAQRNFWLFLGVGFVDLIVGLALSVYTGLSHSWFLAGILGVGFFASANLMFYLAYKKLG